MKRTWRTGVKETALVYGLLLAAAWLRSGFPPVWWAILAGALLIVPVGCDLFRGRAALKALLESRRGTAELLFLSAAVFEIVFLLVRIYLNLLEIPAAVKY